MRRDTVVQRTTALLPFVSLLAASPAAAQGVPVFDAEAQARTAALIAHADRDLVLQRQHLASADALRRLADAQLSALQNLSAATGPGSVPARREAITALETGRETLPAGAQLYASEDKTPGSARLFGDAAADIETLIIRAAAETYGLSGVQAAGLSPLQWRCLLQALVWQESRFQIGARSPAGAYGLTQIMPATASGLGINPQYFNDPYLQLTGGARYLAQMLAMFDGNLIQALAAYNAGPGNVRTYGGVPPFKETQAYVLSLPAQYNRYLAEIGGAEARGSIDPLLLANATLSLSAHGAGVYGDYAMVSVAAAAARLRALIARIPQTRDVQDALALNAYTRAELVRILAIRARLKAARLQPLSAEALQMAAARARDRAYLTLRLPDLP